MPTVRFSSALRVYTGGEDRCVVGGRTVGEVVGRLAERYPQLAPRLLDGRGGLASTVFILLGEKDVRRLREAATAVEEDSVLTVYPAVAGG